MAPQENIPLAANVLGTIGTVFWCIQLIPQVWHNWRRKKTEGVPNLMFFLWSVCGVPLGVYAIVQNFNVPIQIQPQIFGALALICWGQGLYYKSEWPRWKATLTAVLTGAFFAGTEALLIFTLKGPYRRGVEWPMVIVGVVAAILLAAGLIPPYFELCKRNGRVIGINFLFLSLDLAGAIFSLLSLAVQNTFDVLGGVQYIVCALLEIGIFTSHFVWCYRNRKVLRLAKQAGKSYDDYIADTEHSSTPSTAVPSTHDLNNGRNEAMQPSVERHNIDLENGNLKKESDAGV